MPSRESPDAAIELLLERGYSACEIDFEGGFWMKPEWEWAARFGELAKKNKIVLSIHAPIAAILGHLPGDEGKRKRAFGMIDHSAGVATAVGAELLVVHPGYLLGREREAALESVADDLAALRERLEPKGRTVAFGVEIMGRVRELGTPEDVFWLAARFDWVRPVLDFAHLHAVTDGGFTNADVFAGVLAAARVRPSRKPGWKTTGSAPAALAIPAEWSSIPTAMRCFLSRSTWPMKPAIGACTDRAIFSSRARLPNSAAHS